MERIEEINQAVCAADEALEHLQAAHSRLTSAGQWGFADMLGGGFLFTAMKHSRLNDAKQELAQVRTAIQHLADELRDVESLEGIDINVGDFLTLADFFWDGIVADWLVQSRISEAKKKVETTIDQVTQIRTRLCSMR